MAEKCEKGRDEQQNQRGETKQANISEHHHGDGDGDGDGVGD